MTFSHVQPFALRPRWLAAATLSLLAACAGGETGVQPHAPAVVTVDQLDGDPLALLPPGPILALTFDARAFYDSPALGAEVAALVDKLLPRAADAGFSPSRDVDRVVIGSYALQTPDVLAVLRGDFDAEKIVRAAGGALVSTPYADRQIYSTSAFGFTVLTPRTVLVGTGPGLRHALDRIHDARVKRELPPWMMETLETKGAAFALAADFGGAPLSGVQGLPIPPWITSVKTIRGVGDFREPGVHVTGTVAFDDPARAASGASGMRQLGSLVNTAALAGVAPQLKDLTVAAEGSTVQVTFAVDEAALRGLLQQMPQYMGKGR